MAFLTLILTSCASSAAPPFVNPSHDIRHFGAGGALTYVVMGDSTAAGQGAAYEQGIALSTARELGRTHAVALTNLAISGARIADVVQSQLQDAAALHPDVVLLSVGANDVTHLTSAGSMRGNMVRIAEALRAASPGVAIVITGSPDMESPPRIPWLLRGIAGRRTRVVNTMFREVAAANQLTFAPIAEETGPLFKADHSLFASDRFHPNARGYALWIPILNRALSGAVAGR